MSRSGRDYFMCKYYCMVPLLRFTVGTLQHTFVLQVHILSKAQKVGALSPCWKVGRHMPPMPPMPPLFCYIPVTLMLYM